MASIKDPRSARNVADKDFAAPPPPRRPPLPVLGAASAGGGSSKSLATNLSLLP